MARIRGLQGVFVGQVGMIEYEIGHSGQKLVLTEAVLVHLSCHRQMRWYQREAGGQLFARLGNKRIVVERATGPRQSDRRTRLSYRPDRTAEQIEIVESHSEGLHYIGDWHTHPERYPEPSPLDSESIAQCFARSAHDLNAFVLVIVGQAAPPEGINVSVHDARVSSVLKHTTSNLESR